MNPLNPEGEEVIAFYRERQAELWELADEFGVPTLGPEIRRDLGEIVGAENVQLVETIARFGSYGDSAEMSRARNALSKELKRQGFPTKPGKRTAPGLQELVEDLTPVLRYFGIPLSLSEHSPLVNALRHLAEGMDVPGDPRNELRKLRRIDEELTKAQVQAIRAGVKNGLASLKVTTPPQ